MSTRNQAGGAFLALAILLTVQQAQAQGDCTLCGAWVRCEDVLCEELEDDAVHFLDSGDVRWLRVHDDGACELTGSFETWSLENEELTLSSASDSASYDIARHGEILALDGELWAPVTLPPVVGACLNEGADCTVDTECLSGTCRDDGCARSVDEDDVPALPGFDDSPADDEADGPPQVEDGELVDPDDGADPEGPNEGSPPVGQDDAPPATPGEGSGPTLPAAGDPIETPPRPDNAAPVSVGGAGVPGGSVGVENGSDGVEGSNGDAPAGNGAAGDSEQDSARAADAGAADSGADADADREHDARTVGRANASSGCTCRVSDAAGRPSAWAALLVTMCTCIGVGRTIPKNAKRPRR